MRGSVQRCAGRLAWGHRSKGGRGERRSASDPCTCLCVKSRPTHTAQRPSVDTHRLVIPKHNTFRKLQSYSLNFANLHQLRNTFLSNFRSHMFPSHPYSMCRSIQNTRSTVWLSADILILMSLFLKKNSQGSETQALPVTGPHGWPQRSMQLFPLLSQQVSLSCSNEEFTQMPPHKHNNPDLCFRLTESVHMNCFSFVYM